MPSWLSDAANVASIIEAFLALIALVIATISFFAAKEVWPKIRNAYLRSVTTEQQTGTQVIGDHANVTVTQVVGAVRTESDEEKDAG